MKKLLIVLLTSLSVFGALSCQNQSQAANSAYSIAVFIPGAVAGSPTYELLVTGVNNAVTVLKEKNIVAEVKVIEGGFDQAKWLESLTAIAATKKYSLIVSSNSAIPELCAKINADFPEQKFLILDSILEGNKTIKTISFDPYQQAFLNGYHAALVTKSSLKGVNKDLVLGLVAAQEYSPMSDQIIPGFTEGAQAVDQNAKVELRIVGGWNDSAKAEALTNDLVSKKADVVLTIAGGGNQGVVTAAKKAGIYVQWFDISGYANAPEVIVGSTFVSIDKVASDAVVLAAQSKLDYGTATRLGIKDGAVGFDLGADSYKALVPLEIQKNMAILIEGIKKGSIPVPVKK